MNMIIDRAYAQAHNMRAIDIEAIAVWHMERSEDPFDRHDMIAYRLFKLARSL